MYQSSENLGEAPKVKYSAAYSTGAERTFI